MMKFKPDRCFYVASAARIIGKRVIDLGGIVRSAGVSFVVPAYPGRSFSGTVARISRALDPKTRSMSVEAGDG